ncbi:outer membrane beta-barrel protein [Halosquirtibacter laminarini]|uniref:Outer membrane beta-barrel protein n=1 Tax=Halosquirtibacter laminarini TaxID=3374600 RepID=A0AC61NBF0_9BACT|nr:outer membrane beta-barrel protein [Prolixibacteraceae bacterium]
MRLSITYFLLLFSCMSLSAQSLTGVVCDVKGDAIPFVNIRLMSELDSTHFINGTVTDLKGQFILETKDLKKGSLIVSAIGYENYQSTFNGNTDEPLHIVLKNSVQNIGEVTVRGSSLVQKADRVVYQIDEADIKRANSGFELMRVVPTIRLNELNRKLEANDGGKVKILINGVNATEDDLLTLSPQDIQKVEHFDMPPSRYANSNISQVVNVITKSAIIGGELYGNVRDNTTHATSDYIVSAKYNKKQTQLKTRYQYQRRNYKERIDNSTLEYPTNDQRYLKSEKGEESPFGYDYHTLFVGLSNIKKDKHTFSLDFQGSYVDRFSESLYSLERGVRGNMNSALESGTGTKNSNMRMRSGKVDLYYQKSFSKNQELLFNVVGNIFDNNSDYDLNEKALDAENTTTLYDYLESNSARKSLLSELVYQRQFNKVAVHVGGHYKLGMTDQDINNRFGKTENKLLTSKVYGYGELLYSSKWIKTQLSMGYSSSSFENQNTNNSYHFNTLIPNIRIKSPITKNNTLSLSYGTITSNPSLNQLNESIYYIDTHYTKKGNADLTPFCRQNMKLSNYFHQSNHTIVSSLSYTFANDPILTTYKQVDDILMESLSNEKRYDMYNASISTSSYFFKKKLQVELALDYNYARNHYMNGNSVGYGDFGYSVCSSFYFTDRFTAMLKYTKTANRLNDENIFKAGNYSFVRLEYKYKDFSVSSSLHYIFEDGWQRWTDSVDKNLVKYHDYTLIKDNQMMWMINLSYRLSFGKQIHVNKELYNRDYETGEVLNR